MSFFSCPSSCRFCRCDYSVAVIFRQSGCVRAFRYPVVVPGMLDIRPVVAVDDLDVTLRKRQQYGPGLFVGCLFNEPDAAVEVYIQRVAAPWQGYVLVSVLHIGAEAAFGADDVHAVVLSDLPRESEQLQCLFQSDAFDKLARGKTGELSVIAFGP